MLDLRRGATGPLLTPFGRTVVAFVVVVALLAWLAFRLFPKG